LVSHLLTSVPGCSEVFLLGAVTYSNEAKKRVLSVADGLLEAHGAVSREVAEAMAEGVRRAGEALVAVSTTGVAGPGGGTAARPVGTVWFGFSTAHGADSEVQRFAGGRASIQRQAAEHALRLIRRYCECQGREGKTVQL